MSTSTQVQVQCQTPTTLSLSHLPDDVTRQILHFLNPHDIALFSQLCTSSHNLVSDPFVWLSAFRVHLALSPSPSPSAPCSSDAPLSSAALYAAARTLVCHWAVFTGLFVAGVPVHRRSGFVCVVSRGGVEVPLRPDAPESAYVFGGHFTERAVPSSTPSVTLHFSLHQKGKGPFPVNGLRVRILHAAEPHQSPPLADENETQRDNRSMPFGGVASLQNEGRAVQNNEGDGEENSHRHGNDHRDDDDDDKNDDDHLHQSWIINKNDRRHSSHSSSSSFPSSSSSSPSKTSVQANATFKVNGRVITSVTCHPTPTFQVAEFTIPPAALKPALNSLTIEYARDSSAGYWLRDVVVSPVFLPLPTLDDDILSFPLAAAALTTQVESSSSSRYPSAGRRRDNIDRSTTGGSSSSSPLPSPSSSSTSLPGGVRTSRRRGVAPGARVTPLMLEHLDGSLTTMSQNGVENNNNRSFHIHHFDQHVVNSKGRNNSHIHHNKHNANSGKVQQRPKYLHHKQNFHHRSPRAQQQQVHHNNNNNASRSSPKASSSSSSSRAGKR